MAGRESCLQCVPKVITDEMNGQLIIPFEVNEVGMAVKGVPKYKAAGHDTIPVELFHEMWETIGEEVTEFINDSLKQECLDSGVKYGLTSMVPKGGS